MHHKSCSSLLLPLLPALVTAPSVTAALFPVTTLFLVVAGKSVTAAKSKRRGCETVREIDLGADGVCEVGNDENVLDVCVAAGC